MRTAKSVSATLGATRSCVIQINNMSNVYDLINPQVYMYSGYCCHPPQPTIGSEKNGICSFQKTSYTPYGAVGVLTYDLFHIENKLSTDRMAILFSVPYKFYDNVCGIGLFTTDCECDKALYKEMYDGSGSFKRGKAKDGGINYNAPKVALGACMTNVGNANIKVTITDRLG